MENSRRKITYRIQSTTIPFFSTRTIFIFLAKPQKYKVLLTQMCSLHCCELCVEFKNDLFCVSFFDVKILNSFLFRKQELKQITSMGRNNSQLQCYYTTKSANEMQNTTILFPIMRIRVYALHILLSP